MGGRWAFQWCRAAGARLFVSRVASFGFASSWRSLGAVLGSPFACVVLRCVPSVRRSPFAVRALCSVLCVACRAGSVCVAFGLVRLTYTCLTVPSLRPTLCVSTNFAACFSSRCCHGVRPDCEVQLSLCLCHKPERRVQRHRLMRLARRIAWVLVKVSRCLSDRTHVFLRNLSKLPPRGSSALVLTHSGAENNTLLCHRSLVDFETAEFVSHGISACGKPGEAYTSFFFPTHPHQSTTKSDSGVGTIGVKSRRGGSIRFRVVRCLAAGCDSGVQTPVNVGVPSSFLSGILRRAVGSRLVSCLSLPLRHAV